MKKEKKERFLEAEEVKKRTNAHVWHNERGFFAKEFPSSLAANRLHIPERAALLGRLTWSSGSQGGRREVGRRSLLSARGFC